MSKLKIPKIDLSRYTGEERIDSTIESIILQGLIAFEGNVAKVKKHFSIEDDTVDRVYVKYYSQLQKILVSRVNDSIADDSIETVLKLYKDHLSELDKLVDANKNTKMLSDRVVNSLNRITDRLVSIKESNSKTYDTTVNKLNEQIIKMKTLEKVERGEIVDNSEYNSNQQTVADRLQRYVENYRGTSKYCKMEDISTGKVQYFRSMSALARELNVTPSFLSSIILNERLYRNNFKITYVDYEEVKDVGLCE